MQISGGEPEDRLYLGGAEFVFDQNAGIYLPDNYQHEEGRRQYRNDDYEQDPKPHAMQYQITDHLGNLAVLFSDANDDGHITSESEASDPDEIEVLQRHFYYPFGMDMDGTWLRVKPYEDRYRYNHKELTKGLGWYAYGARYYDAAVGRFAGVDPIGDQFPHASTYNYAENEPVGSIDLWGLQRLKIVSSLLGGPGSYRTSAASGWMQKTATAGASLNHPVAASNIGKFKSGSTNITSVSARIARHAAVDGENLSTGIGSERNALRHTIWSATINQEYGSSIAETLTNAHEGIGVAESASVDMNMPFEGDMSLADDIVDFLNNAIGRSITSEGGDLSSLEIAEKTLGVFMDEGLYTASAGSDGKISIQRTKITQEQYDAALKAINQLNDNGFSPSEQK
jgi:RHS repeat-associated protein